MSDYMPYIPGYPAEDLDWNEISDPVGRIYYYPDDDTGSPVTLTIEDPIRWVAAKKQPDGSISHRLLTVDGNSIYVAPGWLAITWTDRFQW
jgi:hypothetical protein